MIRGMDAGWRALVGRTIAGRQIVDDLIKALQIFRSYMEEDVYAPTHCEHDMMMVVGVRYSAMSDEDIALLSGFGFFYSSEYDAFISYRFGSA